jgi:hypothetical protein
MCSSKAGGGGLDLSGNVNPRGISAAGNMQRGMETTEEPPVCNS